MLPTLCKLTEANPAIWAYLFPVLEFIKSRCPGVKFAQRISVFMEAGLALSTPTDTVQAFLKNFEFIQDTFDNQFFVVSYLHF